MTLLLREAHTLEVTPERAAAEPYPVIPVEVPAGAAELRVAYSVSDPSARIDAGLADPRGAGPGLPGFRGWSGSARTHFLLRSGSATPGYLPGPLPAGRWAVLLGLYVVPGPCGIEITVEVDDAEEEVGEEEPPAGAAPKGPPRRVAGLTPGDLHTHSVHSADAVTPVPLAHLVAQAEAGGLSFLAVTDHNTVSHHAPLAAMGAGRAIRLIPGQEVTTYLGHFNVWGVPHVVDFRIGDDDGLARALATVAEAGGTASICHPKRLGPAWRLGVPDGLHAVEAWGAPWVWANGESLAFWDGLLRRGRRISGVGGSDIHDLSARQWHGLATPTTWVPEDEDPLAAVRAGRVTVSQDPSGPVIVPLGPDGELALGAELPSGAPVRARVLGGAGARLRPVGPEGPGPEIDIDDSEVEVTAGALEDTYLRLELWGPGPFVAGPVSGRAGALWALTNPVFRAEGWRGQPGRVRTPRRSHFDDAHTAKNGSTSS